MSVTFKNATINAQDGTITEFLKDDTKVYKLADIFKDWNGVDNITFSLKQIDELPTMDEDTDDGEDE